ncbi:hypothetical protein [Flavobacterium sp.]|uniref:hypothetical protein n=1 Tax=Flavobacterium sp. TaxID=239 RepID=UPI0026106BBC|nr:hypothetical protein [Flavobacterium sp.]
MFVESAFITREFKEEQIPILEKVTCLSVVNKGTTVVVINGVSIYPTQKQILIPPDGTFSQVQLEVKYLDTKTSVPVIVRKNEYSKERNKILLIYKKLI